MGIHKLDNRCRTCHHMYRRTKYMIANYIHECKVCSNDRQRLKLKAKVQASRDLHNTLPTRTINPLTVDLDWHGYREGWDIVKERPE